MNPLHTLMYKGESGAAGYNAYNRGTSNGRIVPANQKIDFSELTLDEVQARQSLAAGNPNRVFAVGKYQIVPETMDMAVSRLKLDGSHRFTPELQDRIFSKYLIVHKQPAIHGYITGKPGVTLEKAQYALACEWASFSDPHKGNLKSHYGQGNHASISLKESAQALQAMRTEYAHQLEQGRSPKDAWKATMHMGGEPHHQHGHAVAKPVLSRHAASASDASALQTQLNALGHTGTNQKPLAVDGKFGPHTEHAVKAFQQAHGLEADGKVGAQTRQALDQAVQQHQEQHKPQQPAQATQENQPAWKQWIPPAAMHLYDKIREALPGLQPEQHAQVTAYSCKCCANEGVGVEQVASVRPVQFNGKDLLAMHTANQSQMVTADVNKALAQPLEQLQTTQQFHHQQLHQQQASMTM